MYRAFSEEARPSSLRARGGKVCSLCLCPASRAHGLPVDPRNTHERSHVGKLATCTFCLFVKF